MRGLLFLLFILAILPAFAQTRKFPYSDGKKWGLTNENKEILIAPQYDTAFWMFIDKVAVVRKAGWYGLIAADGTELIPCRNQAIKLLSREIGIVKEAGKYHLISISNGQQISPVLFDSLHDYRHHTDSLLLLVTQNRKWYFLNGKGGFLINDKGYDDARFMPEKSNRGLVRSGKRYSVIDLRNHAMEVQDVMPPASQQTQASTQVVTAPRPDDDYVGGTMDLYVHKTGDYHWQITYEKRTYKSVPAKALTTVELDGYSSVERFYYDEINDPASVLKVTASGKTGLITPEGNKVLPCIYDDIRNEGGFYITIKDGKEGLIKPDWRVISLPVLKHIFGANYEAEAYFIEMPDGKKGFMNMHNGKIYIPGVQD